MHEGVKLLNATQDVNLSPEVPIAKTRSSFNPRKWRPYGRHFCLRCFSRNSSPVLSSASSRIAYAVIDITNERVGDGGWIHEKVALRAYCADGLGMRFGLCAE